jgi:hypothetical protein
VFRVRTDLTDDQGHAVEAGQLTAPNGVTYHRRTSRMTRKDATSLVAAGRPVATLWPGGWPERTEVVWHDGEDARVAWDGIRDAVTSDRPQVTRGGAVATAGRWESLEGDAVLVVTWHH